MISGRTLAVVHVVLGVIASFSVWDFRGGPAPQGEDPDGPNSSGITLANAGGASCGRLETARAGHDPALKSIKGDIYLQALHVDSRYNKLLSTLDLPT